MMKIKPLVLLMVLGLIVPGRAQDIDYLEMSLEDLLKIEVTTAGKKAQKIQDIPASVVVIQRQDIENAGYATLNDILEHVTGLYGIDQRAVDGMKFGIRGFWSAVANNIIILVNGVRQERVGADGAVYMNIRIAPEAIDRIEVIRGPMSVNYGTGAFFGVINIITDKMGETRNNNLAFSAANQDTRSLVFRSAYEVEEMKLVLNGGYRDFGGPDEPYSRMSTQNLAENFGVRVDSTGGRYSEEDTFLNLAASYKGFYANVNYDHVAKRGDIFFPAAEEGFLARRTYTTLSIGHTREFSDRFSLDNKITYHKGAVRTDWDWFTEPGEPNFGGDINYREDFEVDVTAFYSPNDRLDLTAGLYYKKIIDESLETEAPLLDFIYKLGISEPAISQAAYATADLRVNQKLQFVLGARADQARKYATYYRIFAPGETTRRGEYASDDIELLPRFAAIFKASEANVFKLLYGEAINHPLTYANAAQAFLEGAPLEPEFITTYELNHSWVPSTRFSTNASIFYNQLDKLIINEITVVDGTFFGNNRNSGKIETSGLELSIKAVPIEGWVVDLSFTAQESDDKSATYGDFDVPYSPGLLAYLKSSNRFSNHVRMGFTARFVDEMKPLYDATIPGRIAPDVDSYFSLGANLRVDDIGGTGYYLQLSGSNITDEQYLFPATQLQITWADKGLIGNSAYYQLTFGKRFGK